MKGLRPLEIFLAEVILFFLLWMWDDYIATLISLLFAFICLSVLVVALISEWMEPSKVPRWYFLVMVLSFLAPVLVALLYTQVLGVDIVWLR